MENKKELRRRNIKNEKSKKNKEEKEKIKEKKIEEQIEKYLNDDSISKVIRPKYSFILQFFNQLNTNVALLLFFALLIALCGDNKYLAFLTIILTIAGFIIKGILGYKSFKYTVYLLYPDKIIKKNLYFKKEKTLLYENLKDIRYGTIENTFGSTLLGLTNLVFIHKKQNFLKTNSIFVPNVPNTEEYRREIVETIDEKYLIKILGKNR